jgi:hypothetical protein
MEYKLKYEMDRENGRMKYIEMKKIWTPFWGLHNEIELVWKIDYSNPPDINISVYHIKEDDGRKNEKKVSEIQMKLYNLDELPFYLRSDFEEYKAMYEVKYLIKKIIEDIIYKFKMYGLIADAILEDD